MNSQTRRVRWEIDVDIEPGETPQDVARRVAGYYFNEDVQNAHPDSASCFTVLERGEDGAFTSTLVDLAEEDDDA